MRHLLDSNIVIGLLQNDAEITQLVRKLMLEGVGLSAISYVEIQQGLLRGSELERLRFEAFVAQIVVLPVDIPVADRCARVRFYLSEQGKRVRSRSLDLLIAATAIEHDLTLVTRNLADYQDVPGLRIHQ